MLSRDEFVTEHLNRLDQYIKEVTGGTITVSGYEKKSVEYFIRLKGKYLWKPECLIKVLRFFSFLRIPTVSKGIIQAEIMPFQLLWLAAIYGLYKDDSTRLINQCIFSTGKKQSKSTWCGLVSLNALCNDREPSARIMIGANSTRQATIIIKYIADIVEQSFLKDYIYVWKSSIIHHGQTGDNIITAVSTDGKNIQGLNTSVSVVDEFCYARSMDIANKLRTGSVSRTNPLQILISTAGESRTTEAYEVMMLGKNILDQVTENDSTFVFIAELDHPDEANNVTAEILRKANPALGYTVMVDQLLDSYSKSKLNAADLAAFKRDHLNMWAEDVGTGLWVDLDIIRTGMREYRTRFINSTGSTSTDLLTGETVQLVTNKVIPKLTLPPQSRVVIGCDFSSVSDVTGLHVMTYNKQADEFYCENIVLLPSNTKVVTRKGGLSLQKWIDNGSIVQNNLPVLNDDLVLEIFRQLKRRYKIENIGYDERLSGIIVQKIQNKLGLECTPVKQDAYSLGKPLNLIEKYLTLGKYLIAPNEMILYQAKQIVIWSDGNSNKKIMKNGSRDSVDNWVAANIAMNIWLRDNEYLFSERN